MKTLRRPSAGVLALILMPACGATISKQDAGAGGAASTATSSQATSSASSAASGMGGAPVDAGMDVVEDFPALEAAPACSSCSEALFGPDHLGAEQHLCVGSLAEGSWYAWINCGCAPPPSAGNCYGACMGSAFCAGVLPAPGPWADPIGACKTCLDAANPAGCAGQKLECAKT